MDTNLNEEKKPIIQETKEKLNFDSPVTITENKEANDRQKK